MQSRDFCYWLQGYFELSAPSMSMSGPQIDLIKAHLSLVFAHEIDPAMGDKKHQEALDSIHGPKSQGGPFLARC